MTQTRPSVPPGDLPEQDLSDSRGRGWTAPVRSLQSSWAIAILGGCLWGSGCAEPHGGPIVIYLDGAGYYSSAESVSAGLREAGYQGRFETFSWSTFLGPGPDHFIAAQSKATARRLADKLTSARRASPSDPVNLMGLSAGTAVILAALEDLPGSVAVDNVVLLSPTVSAEHDLTRVMQHVRRNLYATSSPHDAIAATLVANADGEEGPPAGRTGFRIRSGAGAATREAYTRVINLPWHPSYVAFGWNGGHTAVASSAFVADVIGPRVLTTQPYPLDRPVAQLASSPARNRGGEL